MMSDVDQIQMAMMTMVLDVNGAKGKVENLCSVICSSPPLSPFSSRRNQREVTFGIIKL